MQTAFCRHAGGFKPDIRQQLHQSVTSESATAGFGEDGGDVIGDDLMGDFETSSRVPLPLRFMPRLVVPEGR
jgi:hypothetical protein